MGSLRELGLNLKVIYRSSRSTTNAVLEGRKSLDNSSEEKGSNFIIFTKTKTLNCGILGKFDRSTSNLFRQYVEAI